MAVLQQKKNIRNQYITAKNEQKGWKVVYDFHPFLFLPSHMDVQCKFLFTLQQISSIIMVVYRVIYDIRKERLCNDEHPVLTTRYNPG